MFKASLAGHSLPRLPNLDLIAHQTKRGLPAANPVDSPPLGVLSVVKAPAIYRAHWVVEILFRAWEQVLNLSKALNRRSGEHQLQALVLAGMIAHQLGMRIAKRIKNVFRRARLSSIRVRLRLRCLILRGISDFAFPVRHVSGRDRTHCRCSISVNSVRLK